MAKQPTKTEAIKAFLNASTWPDLAALYNYNIEVQVNVAQDGGERISSEGFKGRKSHGYSDGLTTWKSFRIPWKANSKPEYDDSIIKFDLAEHADAIGLTGWDWFNRESLWVAYDFDAISGHSNNALADPEIEAVKVAACKIPWITVRKSTSGSGLHLYVFLPRVPTANHIEHAALARSILSKMSAAADFDFESKLDVCGGIMWIWARKKTSEGLELIKQGKVLNDIPINWRDHIAVIKGKRKKNLPHFIKEDQISDFEEVTGQRTNIKLDEQHKKLLDYLSENHMYWWDADHWMAVTHTYALKQAHKELKLRGIFDTLATGKEKDDHNCFNGETEILTKDGPQLIKDIAKDGSAYLYVHTLDGMKWLKCEVKSFGVQETVPIKFGNYSSVRATLNHEWYWTSNHYDNKINLGRKKKTYELHIKNNDNRGQKLPLAPIDLPEIDWKGYAHGFVYGDGYFHNCQGYTSCSVQLFKHDIDLLKLLVQYGNPGNCYVEGHGYIPQIYQLPDDWKHLPENPTKSYALGFILGLLSADGFIQKSGTLRIFQSDFGAIQEIRKLAIYAGLRARNINLSREKGGFEGSQSSWTFSIASYNLTKDHFLRQDHKKNFKRKKNHYTTIVSSIDFDDKIKEEVFCAIVPSYHNFTLANGIITGNCFMFPVAYPQGSWSVRRYTQGVEETLSWEVDQKGYTKCLFNIEPSLKIAAQAFGGMEDRKGVYHFNTATAAIKTAQLLGVKLKLPEWAAQRKTKLEQHKDGRLVVDFERQSTDKYDSIIGWREEKNQWTRLFNAQLQQAIESETINYDILVRHLVNEHGDNFDWVIRTAKQWHQEPYNHIRIALKSLDINDTEINRILGTCVLESWVLVNEPFQDEYLGNRKWNRNAPQFRFQPQEGEYKTWNKVLIQCGEGLNEAVLEDGWCKLNSILTGADYLKLWIASLFQYPKEQLPYLFFYSKEERTGKSTFHEAIGSLITKGYIRADAALISSSGFNGELENAVLCAVEETNLQKIAAARNRVKDWVTSSTILIHPKGKTPYQVTNTTHFVQTGNAVQECPIFTGDSRICMIHVPPLDLLSMIPKRQLHIQLEQEAPAFLYDVLNLELPPTDDRLNIPVVDTNIKLETAKSNRTALEVFLDEEIHHVPGHRILYAELFNKFQEWCDPNEIHQWSKIKFGRELPSKYPKGRASDSGSQFYIGNMSFTPGKAATPYVVHKGSLVFEGEKR